MITRFLVPFFALAVCAFAQATDESDVVPVAQKVFDGMAARDAAMIHSGFLPDARLYAMRQDGTEVSTSVDDFVTHLASVQGALLERFTAQPKVLVRGRMAQVWGEYEFLRDGKFGHCGVDVFSLFKTNDGWKIASIAYTSETGGCPGH